MNNQFYPDSSQVNPSNKNAFLQNKYETGYKDADELTTTLLSLEMENFLVPFRNGLKDLINEKLDPRDLYLYKNVYLLSLLGRIDDATCFLHFEIRVPPKTKKKVVIDWPNADRATKGSMLILSKDKNCLTVEAVCISNAKADRRFDHYQNFVDLLNKNIIPVTIVKGDIIPGEVYYMFESPEGWFTHETIIKSMKYIPKHVWKVV